MKKTFLLIPCLITLISCEKNNNTTAYSENGPTVIEITKSNFSDYIKYERITQFTGPAGFSPLVSWLQFTGTLTFAIYNVTVYYYQDSSDIRTLKLDASGCGVTDQMDRMKDFYILKATGTVTYRI